MESADNSLEKQAKESAMNIRAVTMNDFEEALAMLQGRSSLEGGNTAQFVVSYQSDYSNSLFLVKSTWYGSYMSH